MINLVIAGLLLPLAAILLLWRRPRIPAAGWVSTLILAGGMVAFSFFAVPWGYLGMPLRWGVVAMFVVAVLLSLRRAPDPERPPEAPTRMMVKVLIGLFFGSVAFGVLRGRSVPPAAVDLAFPLARGPYAVVHGGSTNAANTYFGRGAAGFAVDLVKVSEAGMARSLTNERVLSPCDGVVERASPLRIRCGEISVELSPMQTDIAANARVQRGADLGTASQAYLHVHAERNGQPVAITFGGRWLTRNDIVQK